MKRYQNPTVFKYCISNLENSKKRDDLLSIKNFKLPGDLTINSKPYQFVEAFTQKLKVIWQPIALSKDGIYRMQDAFIDNSYVKEEIIHKIVEVRVW